MKQLIFSLLLILFTISTQAQTLQEIANGLEIESVQVIRLQNEQYLEVSFTGSEESFIERSFSHPRIKVELSNGTFLEEIKRYVLTKTVIIRTDLKKLPENFSCKVHLNTIHSTEPDLVFSYSANPLVNYEFKITNIELVQKDKENFLKISIVNNNPDHQVYSYPIFRIESDKQLIAQRELSTYALNEIELIPTTLKKLPKDFRCTVYLDSFGDSGDFSYQLNYQKEAQ